MPCLRFMLVAAAAFGALLSETAPAAGAATEPLSFEQHIRPILRAHCFDCHGATDEKQGALDLRLVRFQVRGGDSGPALIPGKPEQSLLLQRIRAGEMPPGDAKVSAKQMELLGRWIAQGAPTARPEPETIPPGLGITPEERAWWSFQPVMRPQVASFAASERIRTPIDALLRAAMPAGLSFSPDADKLTLLKRACFDLTGLPPTGTQIRRFLADQSPDAYERLIDELLSSPHYGERWGRHWLDIAGYADSEGGTTQDAVRPWAYKYRDYVIRSLNSDKPFDQFIAEQLAGDELAGALQGDLTAGQIELLTATGFLRMAVDGTGSGNNSPEARNQVITDTLSIVSTSLLGLTVACAQCHDHRYDPIPQADYYALRAVFEPALDWQNWNTPAERRVSLYTAADRQQAQAIEAEAGQIAAAKAARQQEYIAAAVEKELSKFDEPLREQLRAALSTAADQRSDEQKQVLEQHPSVNITPGVLYQYNQAAADDLKTYDERIAAVRARKPTEEFLRVLRERPGHAPETKLFHRGDYRQPLQTVEPAAPAVLCPEDDRVVFAEPSEGQETTGRRLAFARWLTGPQNPLTARVVANRVWLHHFGRGLVTTPADFGRLGAPPTHPALLDWLADELIRQGWSLKALHRQIMCSTVYRQSSLREPGRNQIDPENRYYWRKDVIRLDAEALTDRLLAAGGQLQPVLFGPPAPLREDETGQVIVDGEQRRRALYVQRRRTQPVALLQAFDAPLMQTNCEARSSSTVATQSLMLMNGEFVLGQAARLAGRILREPLTAAEEMADIGSPAPPLWQFGYGRFETGPGGAGRTATFTSLPHWTGSSWQGGAELPDPALGWVILNAGGGHAGDNPDYSAIRRWTAPAAGSLRVTGILHHGSEHGDGVRGRLVSSRTGLIGEWIARHGDVPTPGEAIRVEAGDTIDFITDCRENVNSDSFGWSVELALVDGDASPGVWKSSEGFRGPLATDEVLRRGHVLRAWQVAYLRSPTADEMQSAIGLLTTQLGYLQGHPEALPDGSTRPRQALTNLCQALVSSNEFLYVD
jgi:Protein of unknown function (DUF1553)/Protein of unknown function (DUF1549)/Planctomycete cytochrome C